MVFCFYLFSFFGPVLVLHICVGLGWLVGIKWAVAVGDWIGRPDGALPPLAWRRPGVSTDGLLSLLAGYTDRTTRHQACPGVA